MKVHEYIKKLQGLSDPKKKIIFFAVIIVSGLILGFFWVKSTGNNLAKIGNSLQAVNLPKIDLPDMGGLEATPTPSPTPETQTADWNTYQNDDFGFKIKYPKDWQQRSYNINAQALLGFCPMSDTQCKGTNIYLVIYENPYTVKDASDYYLGKSAFTGFYYYLNTDTLQNKDIFENMILTFKFTK